MELSTAQFVLLQGTLALIYIISHIYDFVTYPFYYAYYKPWTRTKYHQGVHARKEERQNCTIFHSLKTHREVGITMKRNGLDTMDKIFDFVSKTGGSRNCLGTRIILGEDEEVQPDGKTMKKQDLGDFKYRTFEEMSFEATLVAKALRQLGLRAGDKIAIFAETRAEWILTAYACFKNNISIVTIYANLGNDGIAHVINETQVGFLVCSNDTMPKVGQVIPNCPSVHTLIAFESPIDGKLHFSDEAKSLSIFGYKDLLKMKFMDVPPASPPTPKDCAIIMYTSGSTGTPKGVLISHDNMVASILNFVSTADYHDKDRYLAYLPLSHIFELMVETSVLMLGMEIGYSSAHTLTDKSSKIKAGAKGDATLFKPTFMCAVPLIMERIYKNIIDTIHNKGWFTEQLFHYFVQYKTTWEDRGFDTPILNNTLFKKIRNILGGHLRLMGLGGAPLSPDTHSLIRTCLCAQFMPGYGLTETTACATGASQYDRSTGRVGDPAMNCQIKLVNWDEGSYLITDYPFPRGEIHVGGRTVAMGYFKNDEKTKEDFYDEDGIRWFRTGDIGQVETDGVVRIVDRKKDLVKLQHGEYISYGKIESILKTNPIVDNICVYADPYQDFCLAIVIPSVVELASLSSLPAKDAIKEQAVIEHVASTVAKYGLKMGLEKFECPKKVLLTLDEWTPDNGLVTASFKLRRRFIEKRYEAELAFLFT